MGAVGTPLLQSYTKNFILRIFPSKKFLPVQFLNPFLPL